MKNKKIKLITIILFITSIFLVIILGINNKKYTLNVNNNIFEMYIEPSRGDNKYSYYISIDNNNVLYYKIGFKKNSNLLKQIVNDKQITKNFIKTSIKEKNISLNYKEITTILKLLINTEKTLMPQDDIHITSYDGLYQYYWFNNHYYNTSALLMVDDGYYEYKELLKCIFGIIESTEGFDLQSFYSMYY